MKSEFVGEVIAVENHMVHIEYIAPNGDKEFHTFHGNSLSVGDIVQVNSSTHGVRIDIIGRKK